MSIPGAENLLGARLGLRPREELLLLVDGPLRSSGEALCAAGRAMGARAGVRVLDLAPRKGLTLLPAGLLREVSAADVIISLFSEMDLSQEPVALRAAMAAFRGAARGRWAFGAYMNQELLGRELETDYRVVAETVDHLAEELQGTHVVRITGDSTDLRFSIEGRPVQRETGVLTEPGAYANLPAGEVFVAPLEESAEGTLVVNLCLADLELLQPVTLTFKRGRVISAGGSRPSGPLLERLSRDSWAGVIGEFGLGANPTACRCGRVSVDEKVAGTVHIALGSNRRFGGQNLSVFHLDCVFDQVAVYLDDRLLQLPHPGERP